jgi:hypothetical protein
MSRKQWGHGFFAGRQFEKEKADSDSNIFSPDQNKEFCSLLPYVCNTKKYEQLRRTISEGDFQNFDARVLLFALEEQYRAGKMSLDDLLERMGDEYLKNRLMDALNYRTVYLDGEHLLNISSVLKRIGGSYLGILKALDSGEPYRGHTMSWTPAVEVIEMPGEAPPVVVPQSGLLLKEVCTHRLGAWKG